MLRPRSMARLRRGVPHQRGLPTVDHITVATPTDQGRGGEVPSAVTRQGVVVGSSGLARQRCCIQRFSSW